MTKYLSSIICPYHLVPYEEYFANFHPNLLKIYEIYDDGDRDIVEYETETRKINFYGKEYEIPVPIMELKKGKTYKINPDDSFKVHIHTSVPTNPVSDREIDKEITFKVLSELKTYHYIYDRNNDYSSKEGYYEIEII